MSRAARGAHLRKVRTEAGASLWDVALSYGHDMTANELSNIERGIGPEVSDEKYAAIEEAAIRVPRRRAAAAEMVAREYRDLVAPDAEPVGATP